MKPLYLWYKIRWGHYKKESKKPKTGSQQHVGMRGSPVLSHWGGTAIIQPRILCLKHKHVWELCTETAEGGLILAVETER